MAFAAVGKGVRADGVRRGPGFSLRSSDAQQLDDELLPDLESEVRDLSRFLGTEGTLALETP